MRRFPVPSLGEPGDRLVLAAEPSHHCLVVCQIPRGSRVELFAQGSSATARLVDVIEGLAVFEQDSVAYGARQEPEVVVVVGLSRKPVIERILRMTTELGVHELRLFIAERSVARGLHEPRWRRILESAALQCGRGQAPRMTSHDGLEDALTGLAALPRYVLVPGADNLRESPEGAVLVSGPEGGLTDAEIELAEQSGCNRAGLGGRTLRADTAVVAAVALLSIR